MNDNDNTADQPQEAGRPMTEDELKQYRKDNGLADDDLPLFLTMEDVEAVIVSEQYHVFPGTTTTVCRLGLINGFGAVGFSGCLRQETFNEELGRKYARVDALRKVSELEGYRLRDVIHLRGMERMVGAVVGGLSQTPATGANSQPPATNEG